jgi:hypothetical protein
MMNVLPWSLLILDFQPDLWTLMALTRKTLSVNSLGTQYFAANIQYYSRLRAGGTILLPWPTWWYTYTKASSGSFRVILIWKHQSTSPCRKWFPLLKSFVAINQRPCSHLSKVFTLYSLMRRPTTIILHLFFKKIWLRARKVRMVRMISNCVDKKLWITL